MRLALMQPYFFPYIGYFSLMDAVDEFVFFDTVKFQPKSWMTRNRLLNKDRNQTTYFKPALKKTSHQAMLEEVELNNAGPWREKILSQLQHHKKAPFYRETTTWLKGLLEQDYCSLLQLNVTTTAGTAQWIGIGCQTSSLKEKNLTYQSKPATSEWGLWVAVELGATAYINSPGGAEFIPAEPFTKKSIRLGFVQPQLSPYCQANDSFLPALSILDVLIWNGRAKTGQLVKHYGIDWKN